MAKSPRDFMVKAIDLSKQSIPEEDGRVHPLVGAVIVRGDQIIAEGYRGMKTPGYHAEQEALGLLKPDQVVGATVYSTLEPCVIRGKQMPCSQRLIDHQIDTVYYGMLDPNRDIRGQGEWKMEVHGIKVRKFDPDLVQTIRGLNHKFIAYMSGLGILITSLKDGHTITTNKISVSGVYRLRPTAGDKVRLFVRKDDTYYPQAGIKYDKDSTNWVCPEVWVNAETAPKIHEVLVARVSDDLAVSLDHYSHVHTATGHWVGLTMSFPPSGFEVLTSVSILRAAK